MSVLTEERYFGGSLADLAQARAACALPLLRKDFIVDSYQLAEASSAGASAVLLNRRRAPALGAGRVARRGRGAFTRRARRGARRGRTGCALELGAEIIGVNNRDLRDFSVEVERTFELLDAIAPDTIVVAESGINSAAHLAALRERGVHAH